MRQVVDFNKFVQLSAGSMSGLMESILVSKLACSFLICSWLEPKFELIVPVVSQVIEHILCWLEYPCSPVRVHLAEKLELYIYTIGQKGTACHF